jgi:hypothetical protein
MQAIKQFCIISILALLSTPCLQASTAAKPTISPAQKALFDSLRFSAPDLGAVQRCFTPANPNETADDGETALTMAVAKNTDRVDLLNALVKAGAEVDTMNAQGDTPLHVAAYQGNSECFKRLLSLKANPNVYNAARLTVLGLLVHKASGYYDLKARNNAVECIDALACNNTVDLDAAQNVAQGKDVTALCMACDKGNQRAFRLIVQAGADLYAGNPEGILRDKLKECSEKAAAASARRFDSVEEVNKQNETDKFQGMLDMLEIQKKMRLQITSACLEKSDHIGIPAIVALVQGYCSDDPKKGKSTATSEIPAKKLYYAAQ